MSCKVELKAERALRSRRPEILMSTCAVYIKRESYNVLNKVTFDSVRDFQIDGDQYLTVYMQPSDQCSASVKEGYRERITVQSRDVITGRCTSNGDPHYNTYDGRYFDNYIEGDFVLHRSQNRYFEVHTRTWRCWRVACNCGVVVRENNDVVGVTMCDGEWGKTAPRVIKYSDGNFTAGVSIAKNKSGKRFTIKMPSGSKVVTKTGMWGMNVELTVPGDDFGGTVGLCGVFDDDVTNDYTMSDGNISEYTRRRPHEFISSWMIPSGKSLFDKVPDKIEDGLQNREDRHRGNENCECFIDAKPGENKEGGCSMSGRARRTMGRRQTMTSITELVNDTKSKLGSRRKLKRAEAIKRKRRIQREVLGGEVTWPTEGGITFENAEERCRSAIHESPIAGHCADVPSVDLFLGLEGCIEDIGLTDSFDLVYVAVEEMIDHCEDVAVKNVSLYSDDAEEKSPPSFLGDFICPQQCSYHGDCLDGVCHCHKDYGGSDCSVDLTRPPDVWFIEGSEHHGLCDVRSGFCRSISIIGDNFLNSEALKCHYEFVRMDDQGWTAIDKNKIEADVFFVSFREVYCQPKETILDIGLDENTGITSATLRVTASNDAGITESKGMAITIFDSKCLHCDNTGLCTLKKFACEINGQCFAHGEYHPTNAELQCLSDKNQYKWSMPDGFVGFTLIAMAIGIPIAGLVMAAVTVVLTFWLYKRSKAKVDTI
ncbi:von Willebrand factor D and EGF domain-containing protein-like [Ptychodera flava]|uniref:von Willebrand factor D and EGF domain-containing protein-like n=1 Tax=Ptychodera flava TaxID=63121 RepID=UPI00396A01DF